MAVSLLKLMDSPLFFLNIKKILYGTNCTILNCYFCIHFLLNNMLLYGTIIPSKTNQSNNKAP